MIEIKNLSFSYGKRKILRDISFTAQDGECVGVLGNNGAGKSTLVTCINRIRIPVAGEVLVDKKAVQSMSRNEIARIIAYVAQKNEMTRTTVFDSVLLGRKPYIKWGISQEDLDLCAAMIQQVGLEEFQVRWLNELSGGELQKVMLARALVQQPKVLLLDEPTSNLDPRNQYEMMKLVRQMAREQGITVLVVIHDLNLALRHCSQFLLIKDGSVYAYGDESIVTEQALRDVYGINASLIIHDNKKFAIIE